MQIKCNILEKDFALQKFFSQYINNKNIEATNKQINNINTLINHSNNYDNDKLLSSEALKKFQSKEYKMSSKEYQSFNKYRSNITSNINIIIKKILEQYNLFTNKTIHINLLFCSRQFMQNLNKEFRGKDYVADVLSFQDDIISVNLLNCNYSKYSESLIINKVNNSGNNNAIKNNDTEIKVNDTKAEIKVNDIENENNIKILNKKNINLGEIAMCCAAIYQHSISEKLDFNMHFYFMFVHSFLHLLGFDHENEQDYELMELEQAKIMNIINKLISL